MGSHAIVPKTNMTDPRTRIRVSNRVARYYRERKRDVFIEVAVVCSRS